MYLNCDEVTLQSFITNVLKARLGINEPSITIGSNVIYEEGQDAEAFLKVNRNIMLRVCEQARAGIYIISFFPVCAYVVVGLGGACLALRRSI